MAKPYGAQGVIPGAGRFFGTFDGEAFGSDTSLTTGPGDRSAVLEGGVLHIRGDFGGAKMVFHATNARTGALVFGESAMQVLAASGGEARVDPMALHEYLATGRLLDGPRTLLEDVQAIPRGWRLEARGAACQLCEDGSPRAPERPSGVSMPQNADALRDLLARSIAEQTSGVRAAIALSGGIDSSGLLALVALQRSRHPVDAFCFAAEREGLPQEWDEWPWAERAAAACGARLHRVEVVADEVPGLAARAVIEQDFPFASPVILAQRKMFAEMSEAGHEVVLGGHGPEILFGGSGLQAALRAAQLVSGGNLIAAGRLISGAALQLGAVPRDLWAATLGYILRVPPLRRAGGSVAPWASARWFAERASPCASSGEHPRDVGAIVNHLLSNSLGTTSLLHEACNAAAADMDARQPYLAAAIIASARTIPLDQNISADGAAKQVLRMALRGLVPDAILDRRDRVGFAVPALPWLLQQRAWVEPRFRELRSLPFFAGPSFGETWATLEAGGTRGWSTAWQVWRWVVLLEWATARNARFE